MLTGFHLRSRANSKCRDPHSRRSVRNEIVNVLNIVEIMSQDLKRKRTRGTTEVVMPWREYVNGDKKYDLLAQCAPVFLIVSVTL